MIFVLRLILVEVSVVDLIMDASAGPQERFDVSAEVIFWGGEDLDLVEVVDFDLLLFY